LRAATIVIGTQTVKKAITAQTASRPLGGSGAASRHPT
jgi:hypothetical protein